MSFDKFNGGSYTEKPKLTPAGLSRRLRELKKDVEQEKPLKGGFEDLKKSFEKNEAMKDFLELTGNYIEYKLDSSFNKSQKDIIKLAVFAEIEQLMDLGNLTDIIIKKILNPIQNLIAKLSKNPTDSKKEDLEKIGKDFNEIGEKFGISGFTEIIDKKIGKINKNKDKKFDNLDSVFEITSPENVGKITKQKIQKDTKELAEKLASGKKVGKNIKEGLKKLPMGLGETIMNWVKEIAQEYPIIGLIISIFFGIDFLNESGDDNKKSLSNLVKFSKTDLFKKNSDLKVEELAKLDSEKLDKFFKFVKSKKGIDSTSDTFWQELLTGNTKNEEIKKLYNLLEGEKTTALKNLNTIDKFAKILNSLSDLEEHEQQEKLQAQAKQTEKKVETTKRELQQIKTKKTKIEQQKQQAEQKVQQAEQEALEAKRKAEQAEQKNDEKTKRKALEAKKKAEQEALEAKRKAEQARKKAEELAKQEKAKQEVLAKQEAERKRIEQLNKPFAELLKEGKIRVGDKLENISVDENNHILQIGKDNYKISIEAGMKNPFTKKWTSFGDKLEKISFNNGILYMEAAGSKKDFQANDLKDILKELIAKGNINKPIKGKPAKLVIKK